MFENKIGKSEVKVKTLFYETLKRVFDFCFSLAAICIVLPVYIAVAIIIKLDSPGPIIFSHERIGKNGNRIKIYKFRTMKKNAQELFENFTPKQKLEFQENYKLKNDPRVTRVGEFLRKTSIDELPQFWNVLKGDISVVGHRPIVDGEIEKYASNFEKIFAHPPGLTGYWQVNGRSDTTYEQRVAMDLYYCENRSIFLDIQIIIATVKKVIQRKGAF
ncbi:MAG: sugar transferase [Spirochaetaceae bacterium]|nr:sugar transferase [Spirochaetaceae bacterium]